jgi:hypothetical protein
MAGVKGKGCGGVRAGAGRPRGKTAKIHGADFLRIYKEIHGTDLAVHLAQDMHTARLVDDRELLFKYQSTFAKYFFTDVATQDITSNGQALAPAQVLLVSKELDEWKEPETTSPRQSLQ